MSQEVLLSQLELFKRTQFQASIEGTQLIQYRPISTINDTTTIEFDIPVSSDELLDLENVFIFIKARAVKQDDTEYQAGDDDRFALINYGVNTIFDQLSVYLNGTLVSQASKTYHYTSIIQALTENTHVDSTTSLACGGFVSSRGNTNYQHNGVVPELFQIVRRSKMFTLFGKLHADIFRIDRLLLNGVNMRLALSRANNNIIFYGAPAAVANAAAIPPIAARDAVEPKLDLRECFIYARKVKPTPSILNALARALHTSKAKYPFKRTNTRVINLPANQSSYTCDNIYISQMPCKLILGLVSNDAFNGTYTSNALTFQHNNLSFLCVYINGQMYPSVPFEPNFEANFNHYEREFYEFLLNLGYINNSLNPSIDLVNWPKGHCLFSFNFNADFNVSTPSNFISLPKEGFLSVELRFRANVANALKLITYAEFDNLIEIDEARNVTVDFA